MGHGNYDYPPESFRIEIQEVNRELNYVYVCKYLTDWCTNTSYDLKDFETKLEVTLKDGHHKFNPVFFVSCDFERNLKRGD